MTARIKKAPSGPMHLSQRIGKRGLSIASVAVSFAVPIIRRIAGRAPFAAVPFDPDVNSILAPVQCTTPSVIPEEGEAHQHRAQKDVKRRGAQDDPERQYACAKQQAPIRKFIIRAMARHQKSPCIVDVRQTRKTGRSETGLKLSNPFASYRPYKSSAHHVYVNANMVFVTELRHALFRGAELRTIS